MKGKTEKRGFIKAVFYAVKIIMKCSPGFITVQLFSMISSWFFTGFVQEILFLRMVLKIIEGGGTYRDFVFTVIMFAAAGILSKFGNNFFDWIWNMKSKKFYKNLNKMIFAKAREVDIECYENPEFFDYYKRATEILTENHYLDFATSYSSIFADALTGIFIAAYVISIDPKLLLVLLLILPMLILQAYKGRLDVKKDKDMTFHKRTKAYVKRIIYLKDFSKDMRTSDILAVLHKRYKDAVKNNRKIIKKYGCKAALLETFTGLFGRALPVVIAYIYATFRYAVKKNLRLADFSVIMTAMDNIKSIVNDMGSAINTTRKEALYFENLRVFLEYESKVVSGSKEAEELETLEFRNVTFTYPGAEKPTLKNINVVFRKGETTAIVGHNGAGKTTFVKLLLRFYDPQEGVILYNGIDLKEYDITSLRNRFATVFQDYKVFALSVAENVLCKEVQNEDESFKVKEALKNSGAELFVKRLPEKENTVITREFDEKGTGLSGGEQQKVAVARMFAKDYDFAVLDEPSSALDPVAEYKMYETLIEATKNKTVVYISHRLSSAVLSDKIYVFGNGTVQESGTHESLMEKHGIYAEMFNLQASSYKESEGSVDE